VSNGEPVIPTTSSYFSSCTGSTASVRSTPSNAAVTAAALWTIMQTQRSGCLTWPTSARQQQQSAAEWFAGVLLSQQHRHRPSITAAAAAAAAAAAIPASAQHQLMQQLIHSRAAAVAAVLFGTAAASRGLAASTASMTSATDRSG